MSRVYNFSAGPAVLPEEVLKEAAEEMLDYNGTGMSVMEMSHRSQSFQEIIDTAEADLRELMGIPDNYKVLFLQGGESQQFAMVPVSYTHLDVYKRQSAGHLEYWNMPMLLILNSRWQQPSLPRAGRSILAAISKMRR